MTSIGEILQEIPRNFWIMLQDLNEKEKRLKEFQRNFLCTNLVQVELKRIGRYYKQRNADREYIKKRFTKIRDVEEKLQKAREEISKKKLNLRFSRVSKLPVRRKTQIVIKAGEELTKIKQTYEAMKLSTEEVIAKYEIDKTNKCQNAVAEDVSSKTEEECPDTNLNSNEKDKMDVLHLKPLVCTNVRQQLKECRDILEASDIQKLKPPAVAEQTINEGKTPNCTTRDNDEKPPQFVDAKRTKNGSSGILREQYIPVVKKRINRNLINTKASVAPSKAQRTCFPENKLASRTLFNRNVVAPGAKTQLRANCPDNHKLTKRKLEPNGNLHAQPKRNNNNNKYNMSNEVEGILNANKAMQHVKRLETEMPAGSNGCRAVKRKMFTIPEETGETQSDPDVGKSSSRPRKQPKLVNSSFLESLIKDSFTNICMASEGKDNLLSKNPDNYLVQKPFFNSNPEDLQNDTFSIPGTLEKALSNIYDTSMAQMSRHTVENSEKPPFTRTVPNGLSNVSEAFTSKAEMNRENSDDESLNSFETAKTVKRNSPRKVPNRHEKPDNKPESFDLTMFEDMWSSMLNDSESFKIDEVARDNPPLNEGVFSGNLNFANPTLFSDSESEKTQ